MKKWLCAILCLVLVLGMIPVFPASAAQSEEYSIMQEQPTAIAPTDNAVKGVWYNNGSTFVTDAGAANYIEVVEDGCKDAGALHVYQDNVANHDMSVGMFVGGQPAGTYTVKLNVKGDLGYLNQTCKFFIPGNDAQSPNLHTALGTTDVADWTEVTYEITAASTFYYLIFSFSKYNWQTDMYIDNVKLLNSDGVDLLLGGGDFYTLEEVTVSSGDTKQWPDASALDTSVISSAYGGSLEGVWTPMYPTGTPGNSESWATWPAWDDTHYAEVVANGYKDAGSLHLVSCGGKNTGIAINAGMTAGETYTLGFYAKGTVNTGRVLAMYDNGGGVIISDTASFKAGWNYYEHTFTANRNQLNILAADWGSVDIYLDNITLKNAGGEDLLAGSGDFYTDTVNVYYTVMQEQPTAIAPTDNAVKGVWYNNSSTFVTDAGTANYIEVTKDGCNDAGALHVYQDNVANHDMSVGMFVGGQPAGTYTVKLNVKGDLGHMNQTCRFFIPGNDAQSPNLHTALGTTDVADWTEVSYEITTTGDFYYLIFTFSKYNWKTDMYIDNVKLLNSDGVDLLLGGGDFYTLEEVTVCSDDTKQWPDDTDLDVSTISSAYGGSLENAWTPMYPTGTPGNSESWATWPAWDDTHYAEVVANGYKDAGSLHLVSCGSKNTGIAINAGMTAGETYTLGFYAKGTVNTGRVLAMYDNGGGVIISDTASFKAGWNYYEHTFTATRNQLNILAADWGSVDIYIDNITLKNAGGEDLLAGIGDFYRGIAEEPETPSDQPTYQDPTEEGWIGRDTYTQLELGVDYDYSFAVLGDIQHITDYTPTDLPYLFDYILDNKETKNIQFVFGMGDTTNDNHNEANNLVEWKLAQEQFFRFNGVLPYTVIRGNHDVVKRMNAYFADPNKPGYTDQLDGFYQEGSVVNVWKEFSVAGVDYLSLLIDYEASDSVLAWAADVIESHPNHRVIVNTHIYLQPDGSYDNEMNPQFVESGTINNAQQVWDKLISQHENIFMVLSGHESSDDVMIQQKTGIHGNTVTELRIDSQYTDLVYMNKDGDHRGGDENGVGMVTFLYFKEDGTQVAVEHYSVLRQWYRQLQTFEIEAYDHYNWRYNDTVEDSYQVEVYQPATEFVQVPVVIQDGMGAYNLDELIKCDDMAYAGTGASIIPDYNMNLGNHTYALHSGSRTVEPSQTYTISYKIKGLSDAGRTWTQIHFCRSALGGSDTWETQWSEGQFVKGPVSDWQTVSYDVTMDDKTSAIEIYFIVNGSEMFIDDLSVTKKGNDANIITNGDFESGTDGKYPTGFYTMKTGGIGVVEKVSGVGVNGSSAVRIEPRPAYMLKTAEAISVAANTRYTFSYTLRIKDAVTEVMPVIRLVDASGTVTTVNGDRISGKTDWTTTTYEFQTSADTVGVEIGLLAYGGRVDVDNLSLAGDGKELMTNGNFAAGLQGFTGEFVQGLQEGTVQAVSSARPNTLIVDAKAEQGTLNAYDGESLLGTVDWLYGQLEHKVNYGLRIADNETAQAVAAWITERYTENLWVIASDASLLDVVLEANGNVKAVLDCTADSTAAINSAYAYVLVSDLSAVSELKQNGKKVLLACAEVEESLFQCGADAIVTEDSLAAITLLEAIKQDTCVDGWQIVLGEDIGVRFQLAIPENKKADTVVTITTNGTSVAYTADDMIIADGYYMLMTKMAAAQMTDDIAVKITVAGELVWNKTYSVRQYADYILAGDYTDTVKNLVKEMLSYGAAAQIYFDYNETSLATDNLDLTGVGSVDVPKTAATEQRVEGKIDALKYYGASLVYESKIAVRFYFTGDVADCSFTVNGENVPVKEKNGMWYVEIGQINPDALQNMITVCITKGDQALTVSYSPMNYMVRMNGRESTSVELKALLKAMYNYHLAACEL